MSEKPFFAPIAARARRAQPTPGEEVWRLRAGDRVQSCELRNGDRDGAGWDVVVRENDELLFSRRCVDERGARFVAESFKQDLLRNWLDVTRTIQKITGAEVTKSPSGLARSAPAFSANDLLADATIRR